MGWEQIPDRWRSISDGPKDVARGEKGTTRWDDEKLSNEWSDYLNVTREPLNLKVACHNNFSLFTSTYNFYCGGHPMVLTSYCPGTVQEWLWIVFGKPYVFLGIESGLNIWKDYKWIYKWFLLKREYISKDELFKCVFIKLILRAIFCIYNISHLQELLKFCF